MWPQTQLMQTVPADGFVVRRAELKGQIRSAVSIATDWLLVAAETERGFFPSNDVSGLLMR
ncbi:MULTISPECIES: hypothetical protein [Mesorhizobium]|uniref:hypothetical protein n=1 Tax=Mesorhizobium sp. TaxID=1871066 RepID=UPI000494A3CA|nr:MULTISPECIES: hypothetical protein [Mesorhizobium]TIO26053.1 MAG: hypothetical protein E5X83_11170 [Mesorhizobium sp.]TJV62214.1 MAG: hypothetical protein E5X82_07765 [Mesorhizobium sp.]